MPVPDAAPSILLRGIVELVTNDPTAGPGPLGIVPNAAVIIDDGRIGWIGPAAAAPAADTSVDVQGRAVLPGWVDAHTQVVFARDRVEKFTARMSGATQLDPGPGTVDNTRAAADADLLAMARWHRADMLAGGTTCAATATGYGLTVKDETRSAATAQAAGFDEVIFFGAQTVPAEFADDPDGYLDLVCGPMLDAVAPMVRSIGVTCGGPFDTARTRRVLAAGQRTNLPGRVYGTGDAGSLDYIKVAVDTGAASVGPCTNIDGTDLTTLAGSVTVATLFPVADLINHQPPAPGRAMIDAGGSIAIATGCNPDTCYTSSMNLAVTLAVLRYGLTPAEAIHAGTAGGARALRRDDVGSLTVGARADLHILDAPSYQYLPYRPGASLTHSVYHHGTRIAAPALAPGT
jgi:imidazolonepropionase